MRHHCLLPAHEAQLQWRVHHCDADLVKLSQSDLHSSKLDWLRRLLKRYNQLNLQSGQSPLDSGLHSIHATVQALCTHFWPLFALQSFVRGRS